jgi:ubiquinone/menaquinone biosynthesis C-methylase UbiE
MDQKKLWQSKWSDKTLQLPPNNFASGAYKMIESKHKTLLDLGCGTGRDSLYFAHKGLKVTAADWSQSGLDQLKKLVEKRKIANLDNLDVIQQDISKLTFKPNSFDVIYAHLSLHYFDDKTTKEIFNKLYSILKRDGLLFVKCKSTDDMLYGQGHKLEENMYERQNHVRHFFDKDYMTALLAKFQISKVRRSSSVYHSYKSSFIEAIAKKSGQK